MNLLTRIFKFISYAVLVCCSVMASASDKEFGIQLMDLDALLKRDADQMIFIDVRDPVEIMFTGFTDHVDLNIPYQTVDRTTWNEKKGVFMMTKNPNFVKEVEAMLKHKGLNNNARIVTMCRSGSARGKPSAEYLRENGFPNALYLVHGFQGSSTKEGEHKDLRVQNGWQNSGMPWQKKPNPKKIYRN